MSGKPVTKASLAQRIRGLIAGTLKHPPVGSLTLGGQSFTEQTLVQALQGLADALAQVDTAKANWQDALKHLAEVKATVVPLARAYGSWIRSTYGDAPATLGDYGIAPPKAHTPLTSEQLAAAVAKRRATRAARHTMGSKQKKGVTGDVTGVVVTPITPSKAPAPSASPGTPSPASTPAVSVAATTPAPAGSSAQPAGAGSR